MMFKRGDIFCTKNPSIWLGKPISIIQKLRTPTSTGDMTHAGLFLDPTTTFESLLRVKRQNFYDAYEGTHVLVGRFIHMTPEAFFEGWGAVQPYEGKIYPFTRLLMFMFLPITVKYTRISWWLSFGLLSDVVCSELLGKYAKYAKVSMYQRMGKSINGFEQYRGLMPAHLASRIRHWDSIEVIYDDILTR